MSYQIYKIIHLTGIVMLISGLIGMLTVKMSGASIEGRTKTLVFLSHGIGALLTLVGGFGLLARLELMSSIPTWAYLKMLIWVLLGGSITLVKKKGQAGFPIFSLIVLLFIAAACLAVLKPF